MLRHRFQRFYQRRMVELRMTECRARLHPLRCDSGLRQRDTQAARTLQRQVQVFLMQRNTKAGLEGALDHAFAVYLQDA